MFAGMTIDRIFFVYSAVLGVIVGAVLLNVPASREMSLGPYFWVLIGIAIFEGIAVYMRGGLANGPPMSMQTRLIGFFIAVVPMLFVRYTAGI
jgi:hypothetical protein